MADAKINVRTGTKVEKEGHLWVYARKNFAVDDLPVQHLVVSTKTGEVTVIYPAMHGSVARALRENDFYLEENDITA